MNRRQRRRLVDQVAHEFALPADTSYRELSQRVGQVMSQHVGAPVDIRFGAITNAAYLSGATARLQDGTYLVICANSPSWYYRLQILLHEFAHRLLAHHPITLSHSEGLARFVPHLLPRMAEIIAGRTVHGDAAEWEAEELADCLLERLTERQQIGDAMPADTAAHVQRVVDSLANNSGWAHRDDL